MAALLTCLAASSGYIPTAGYQTISSYAASRYAATSRLEATSRLLPVRTAVSPICCALPDAASMRGKALKAELDGLGVAWKGIAFEKEELVKMVEDARANPQPPPPAPPPPRPPPPPAPPIESWRRSNSPGIANNFYDGPSSDFRKPYGGPTTPPPPPPPSPPPPSPPQAAPRAATAPTAAKFCSQCGAAATPTGKFCAECGVPLPAANAVPDEGTRDSSRGTSAPAAASSGSGSGSGSGGGGADPASMRVAQIKAELKERSIAFSDCFDKDGLTELYP